MIPSFSKIKGIYQISVVYFVMKDEEAPDYTNPVCRQIEPNEVL